MPSSFAFDHLHTHLDGLTDFEAASRLKIAGLNVLSLKKPPSWWQLLLLILPNPFNILLTLLAIISVVTPPPDWKTFMILLVMIIISCAVRFWQEYRSNVAVVKLQSSVTTDIKVRRQLATADNVLGPSQTSEITIDEKDLVPGDILLIYPGDSIPADCMIVEASHLQVSQSSLTGESHPVRKAAISQEENDGKSLFELENIAFMGTSVISGNGLALVLRTGDDAFISTIMKQLNKRQPLNSFQRGIRNVSFMLIAFMLIMVPIVLVISGRTTGDWGNAALFSVSVAVGLVPEMLPAIVNTNLARGAFRLSKRKAIVKRLDSIQNLGGMSILCSDKTGTLTKDETALYHHLDCSGYQNPGVFQLAYINAINQSGKRNGIDSAILNFQTDGQRIGIPNHEKVAEIPFTFESRRSSCIVRGVTEKLSLICKGAYDEVSALCTHVRNGAKVVALDGEQRQALSQQANRLNSEGYRVILVATKEVQEYEFGDDEQLKSLESRMTLEGLLTFLDPLKDDAAVSIERLQALGVEVKVLTGDSLGVTLKVCQSLNLVEHVEEGNVQAITGPDLARLEGTAEFIEVVKTCKVFAKLTPSQKGQVVASLKGIGNCVGMLGDGINDCVALRFADVGISVDSGASVAKDCADVILLEKGLEIIVECVTMGRVTHGNTIKYIKMVASSNFGNVFSILIASAWLPFGPMTSLQILIQNLLYDISQIAIPWDRMDEEYLQEPRRWDARDLFRFIVILGPTSSTIDMCTFCLGWFYYGIRTISSPVDVHRFQTHWFLQGLLTQTIIVHLLRTAKIPLFQRRAARILVVTTVGIMIIGFVIPYITPLQRALAFVRPANSFVWFLLAELALYCVEVQLVKIVYIRIFKAWL
ncbi:MG transport ATPase [Wilcoxina mikolae CBS 423.85]|nr:MG transport ATPase [Wilcoxina mikolae CBS 423.85]